MRPALLFALLAAVAAGPHYPTAAKHPVTRSYSSVSVADDYAWLENFDDPAVKAWVAEENRLTRSMLDAVPEREVIAQRLTALYKAPRLAYYGVTERAGKLFALKGQPPKEQPTLV